MGLPLMLTRRLREKWWQLEDSPYLRILRRGWKAMTGPGGGQDLEASGVSPVCGRSPCQEAGSDGEGEGVRKRENPALRVPAVACSVGYHGYTSYNSTFCRR